MKRNKGGTRGAISVFLAIILVPCIVVSCLFVDVSRVQLSKLTAESAADLALNTLLTQYDADLKDWYGLVASCQDIEQFYTVSADYFIRTLASQGMSDDEIVLLSDYYAAATSDDTIYDLLQVECKTDSGSIVSAVEGANLSNSALMKDQIVEFMKYRAPIEIAMGLINRLKSDPTTKAALDAKADENEKLVEDKQDFYESEGELRSKAYYSYLAIKKFYDAATSGYLTEDQLNADYNRLSGYKTVYQEILRYVVSNLSNTGELRQFNRYTIGEATKTSKKNQYLSLRGYNGENFTRVYSYIGENDNGDKVYYITLAKIQDLVGGLETAMEGFAAERKAFAAEAATWVNQYAGDSYDSNNPIQWWRKMQSIADKHASDIKTSANKFLEAYAKVKAISECEVNQNGDADYVKQNWSNYPSEWYQPAQWRDHYKVDETLNAANTVFSKYLSTNELTNDQYLLTVYRLEYVSKTFAKQIKDEYLYVTVDGQSKTLDNALKHISSQLSSRRAALQNYVDLLDKAIGGSGKTPSLDKLKQYATDYQTELKEWSTTAKNTHTTMGDSDENEIAEIKSKKERNITPEAVEALKLRLVKIRTKLQEAINAIDNVKFGGTSIKDINSIATFKSKAAVDNSRIGLTNGSLREYADNLLASRFTPQSAAPMNNYKESDSNVQLDVNKPSLFQYMQDQFADAVQKEGAIDKADSEKGDAKKKAEEKKEDASKGRYHGSTVNIPGEYSEQSKFGLDDVIKGIFGVIESLIGEGFSGATDDLYVTTYIMEMFSYATFENQGLYNLVRGKEGGVDNVKNLNLGNFEEKYEAVKGKSETDKETWLSALPTDSYNKSLTNKLINSKHNTAYGAEVEYILYGGKGTTNEDNVKDAYNSIYAIRYGLNLVSGFQWFWSGSNNTGMAIGTVATAVQTATAGIVPAAVVKVVLIPLLTVFETCVDLDRLQAGFPVELYKSDADQWWCSLEGDFKEKGIGDAINAIISGDGLSIRSNDDVGLFYSDYLTIFVYLGLNGDEEEQIYKRIGEVIQCNIGTMANKGYSLQKSQVYFQLNAQIEVQPLMITLPYFSLEEYENDLTTETSWCTYKVNTVRGYS